MVYYYSPLYIDQNHNSINQIFWKTYSYRPNDILLPKASVFYKTKTTTNRDISKNLKMENLEEPEVLVDMDGDLDKIDPRHIKQEWRNMVYVFVYKLLKVIYFCLWRP